MTQCKGMNCQSTDGQNHSPECRAEHAAAVAGGRFVKLPRGDANVPQIYAGFAAVHVNETGHTPSEQEAFDAGVRAGMASITPSAPAVDAGARDEREAFEAWFRQDNPAYCANEHRWEELFSLLDEVGQKADIICGSAKRDWRVWQAATAGLTAVDARAMKLLDSIITDMEGGFVKCENCGDQEDTATLDFMPQLRELRAALSAKGDE